jgi:hypothetical protein
MQIISVASRSLFLNFIKHPPTTLTFDWIDPALVAGVHLRIVGIPSIASDSPKLLF